MIKCLVMNNSPAILPPGTEQKHALLSIVIPVYRGATILDDTFARLMAMEKELPGGAQIEIIAVDDGSDDNSFAIILQNQKRFVGKIRALRLSRNYGAIAALQAGLDCARGDCVASVPQDLQEPPELFLRMFGAWCDGIKINIGFRESRTEAPAKKFFAALYHKIFQLLVVSDYPRGGLCAFLVDRQIADELRRHPEKNTDPATRLFLMGYSRRLHAYHRCAPPLKSNWTFAKNIKLVIDNFIGFSYLPVRLMSLCGIVVALASFGFAGYVFVGKLSGWYPINQPPGWATIIVLLTFLLGMVMTMLGVIGEYLWRILDRVRAEPIYRIAEIHDAQPPSAD